MAPARSTADVQHSDFKDDYTATRHDALNVLARVHKICEPLGYYASLYGSALVKGKGHDVDVHVMGLGDELELRLPDEIATEIVVKMAGTLRLFELKQVGDVMDAYVCFVCKVAKKDVYVDIHIKGSA